MFHRLTKNSERLSSSKAFLDPVKEERKDNLHIYTHHTCLKVGLEKKRARYVEVWNGESSRMEEFYANKEIILCGGAINTPQIMMLSGIGPKKHLE
jgi:choline dehydrogenase